MKILKKNLSLFVCCFMMLFSFALGTFIINYGKIQENHIAIAADNVDVSVHMYTGGDTIEVANQSVILGDSGSTDYLVGTHTLATVNAGDRVSVKFNPLSYYEVDRVEILEAGAAFDTIEGSALLNNEYSLLFETGNEDFEISVYFKLQTLKMKFISRYMNDLDTPADELTGFYSTSHPSVNEQAVDLQLGETIRFTKAWEAEYSGDSGILYDQFMIKKNAGGYTDDSGYGAYDITGNQILVTEAFLDDHYNEANDELIIIATYYKIHRVNISYTFNNSSQVGIEVEATRPDGTEDTYLQIQNEYFEEGTTFVITQYANNYYRFLHFTVSGVENSEQSLNETLTGPLNIVTVFEEFPYTLTVIGLYGKTTVPGAGNNAKVLLNGEESTTIKVNDVLTNIEFTDLAIYEKLGFLIRSRDGRSYVPFVPGEDVDEDFLERFLNGQNEVVLAVNLRRLYEVEIKNPFSNMGRYTIEIYDEELEKFVTTTKTMFPIGAVVRITAIPHNATYYTLKTIGGFLNVKAGERQGNVVTLTIDDDRPITINFQNKTFNLTANDPNYANGTVEVSKLNGLQIGEKIYITCDVKTGYNIKSWKLNGKYSIKNLPSNASYANNTIILTITEDWLNENGLVIDNNIKITMKTGVVMAFVLPSIAIVALIAALVYFMIINAKRKKVIRTELTDKLRAQVTMNAGQFIADLREGKEVGKVTEADVKREMKNKKKK